MWTKNVFLVFGCFVFLGLAMFLAGKTGEFYFSDHLISSGFMIVEMAGVCILYIFLSVISLFICVVLCAFLLLKSVAVSIKTRR
jgi:hypothetical protein